MQTFTLSYKAFGNSAILIEWPDKISESILYDILRFKQKIQQNFSEYRDIVTAYNSLTVYLDKDIKTSDKQIVILKNIYLSESDLSKYINYIWHIPVCYNIDLAVDLENLLKHKNISLKTLIKLHTQPLYTVYFLGFLPGFPYLGGLLKSLNMPRKTTPQLKVAKGSVGIGGQQTGVYTTDSPGGWHIIGKTPISFFDVALKTPNLLRAGDKIKFYAISDKDYFEITKKAEKQSLIIKKEKYHV